MGELLPIVFAVAGGLCLLLVLLAAWQSVRVLLADGDGRRGPAGAGDELGRRALEREKASLLAAIRELRFEHDLGKLSDVDLAQLEQRYRGRARVVLRLLDEELEPHREAARKLIEDARGLPSGASAPAADAAPRSVAAGTACAACGTRNDDDAQFCKKCGQKLSAETPA